MSELDWESILLNCEMGNVTECLKAPAKVRRWERLLSCLRRVLSWLKQGSPSWQEAERLHLGNA